MPNFLKLCLLHHHGTKESKEPLNFFFFFGQKVQKEYINPKSPILLQYHIKFVAWYLLIESLSRKLRAKKVG